MVWLLLIGAIVSEIAATVSLKLSDGFSRLAPSVVVVLGYAAAFTLLAQALKRGLPVGVAYAIWSAVGVAAVAAIGAAFLGEKLTVVQAGGIALIIAGVVTLQLGGATH